MNRNSKSNNENGKVEIDILVDLLVQPVNNGQDIVNLSRRITHSYSDCGMSIDDVEIENIIGIESETDTMTLESASENDEFARVYSIYLGPFEEARQSIRAKLVSLAIAR